LIYPFNTQLSNTKEIKQSIIESGLNGLIAV